MFLDIDSFLSLSLLFSLFLMLMTKLNSRRQSSAWFIGMGQTPRTSDLSRNPHIDFSAARGVMSEPGISGPPLDHKSAQTVEARSAGIDRNRTELTNGGDLARTWADSLECS